ncbi:MAG: aminotransferase class V-fold PLP-dependent enzyme [Bdellovibrionales bacterium]|nr:aminotransferase class V-fold PLP-dependent enzyme [Oligoflexia bacterium]
MWQKNVRYLDYNASSGISPFVTSQLTEVLNSGLLFANPTSRHRLGQSVRHALYEASLKIAKSFGESIQTDDLVFTSSGTEANQTVLRSIAEDVDLLVMGAGEHSASYEMIAHLSKAEIFELPLLPSGQYDFNALVLALEKARSGGIKKVGLSLFWANNETGVLTDLSSLKEILLSSGLRCILHLDGAQAWGKTPFDLAANQADFTTFSAHKIGAPAGTGIIVIKKGNRLKPLFLGSQAHGLRGGTENTLGILATAAAADKLHPLNFSKHTLPLIQALEKGLLQLSTPVRLWGNEVSRVPNTSRFSFSGFTGYENWVELIDLKGFAVSHGSACKAQVIEPSRVLLKMGASREEALNSLRVSFGPDNTEDDVSNFLIALQEILETKRK